MTLPVLLGAAWAAVVLVWSYRRRPLPMGRAATLAPLRTSISPGRTSTVSVVLAAVERLGARLRAATGRPPSPPVDRRAGIAICVATAAALLITPAVAPVAVAAVWTAMAAGERTALRREQWAVLAALPDTVDLFVVAVGSGMNVALATRAVSERAPPPIGPALERVVRRVDRGEGLADALERLPLALGDGLRPVVTVLVTSLRYGTPLLESLERLAADVRSQRRRAAEEAARRIPVKLLFPLVLCVLPAFALLTVVPLLAGSLRDLRL